MVACGKRFYLGLQHAKKIAVNLLRRQHPLRGDTCLAGISITGHCHGGRHFVQIGIGHDNERAVGTEFHRYLLDAGHAADSVADLPAAGKCNLAHAPIFDDGIADFSAGSGDTLNPFGRESGLEQNLGEL